MILLTDSISQSSNFCWIVLDETTYYISAFAVDSNGTIIDVQGMSIKTDFWISTNWLLWYWKLQSDLLDSSWNNKNASWYSWTWSFWNVAWKTWARITWNSSTRYTTQHVITPIVHNTEFTYFWWFIFTGEYSTTWVRPWFVMNARTENANSVQVWLRQSASYKIHAIIDQQVYWPIANAPTLNTWYFFALSVSNSKIKVYLNWTLVFEQTISSYSWNWWTNWRIWTWNYNWWYVWMDWYVRQSWLYNRILTDAEISKIYNKTQ